MKKPAPEHPPKRPRVETSAFLGSRGLDQFCTANSIKFFKILRSSEAFLTKDPATWCDDEDNKKARNIVSKLVVVNDRDERGVALIKNFNKTLVKDEKQLQFLLQFVSNHRNILPDGKKLTFVKNTA